MPRYDDWRREPDNPGDVEDHCDMCGTSLFPEERENGRCGRCVDDYEANRGPDDAYERERDGDD